MTRDELLSELVASRQELLEAMRGLAAEQLASPGVIEGWSVKDLLAHLTGWEAELIKAMAQGRAGQRPAYVDLTPAVIDKINAEWLKEFRRKPLDKVMEDLEAVRQQLLKQVGRLDDQDLNDPNRFAWTKGEALASMLKDDAFGHEREHAAEIRAWRQTLPSTD